MKKLVHVFLAVILLFAQISIVSAEKVIAVAKLVEVKGDVFVKKAGGQKEFKGFNNLRLSEGDWIKTGANSSAKIVFNDETETLIASHSQVMISEKKSNETDQTTVKVWSGSTLNLVKSLLNIDDQFDIETPTMVMGVRGTLFLVHVDPQTGEQYLSVFDGAVSTEENNPLSSSEKHVLLNQEITIPSNTLDGVEKNQLDTTKIVNMSEPIVLAESLINLDLTTDQLIEKIKELRENFIQTSNIDDIEKMVRLGNRAFIVNEIYKKLIGDIRLSAKSYPVNQILAEKGLSLNLLLKISEEKAKIIKSLQNEIFQIALEAGLEEADINQLLPIAGYGKADFEVKLPEPTRTYTPRPNLTPKVSVEPGIVTDSLNFQQTIALNLTNDTFKDSFQVNQINLGGDFSNLSIENLIISEDRKNATFDLVGDLSFITGEGSIDILAEALTSNKPLTAKITITPALIATPNQEIAVPIFQDTITIQLTNDHFNDSFNVNHILLGGDLIGLAIENIVINEDKSSVAIDLSGELIYSEGNGTISILGEGLNGAKQISTTIEINQYTVQANPIGGVYNSTQNIHLTPSKQSIRLYYTKDGSEPTTNSWIYEGQIQIFDEGQTVLKFMAIDDLGNQSLIGNEVYTIDTIAPSITVSPTGGAYNKPLNVTLALSDPSEAATIYYTLDGATPTINSSVYSKPFTISEDTTLKYIAIDQAGNQSQIYTQEYTITQQELNMITPVIIHTDRASTDSNGNQANTANSWSDEIAISGNGRYVVFQSAASNLVTGDTNDAADIFVKDTETGLIERVTVSSDGVESTRGGSWPDISYDGKYVVFQSYATNLDPSGNYGVFLHNRETKETTWIASGTYPTISDDGSRIAYSDDNKNNVYLWDADTTYMINDAIGGSDSENPKISGDGRYIVYNYDKITAYWHIVVYDIENKINISLTNPDGYVLSEGFFPDISDNGRFVLFESSDRQLVDPSIRDAAYYYNIFVYDRDTDNNGVYDEEGKTGLIMANLNSTGSPANGTSGSTNGWGSSISGDGRYVIFESFADNLLCKDTNSESDIFLRDLQENKTYRVSSGLNGAEANDYSQYPVIDSTGEHFAYLSLANNLVTGDTNNQLDVFVGSMSFGTPYGDLVPPTILSTDPRENQTDNYVHEISVKFDELIKEGLNFSNIKIYKDYNTDSQLEIEYEAEITDCTLTLGRFTTTYLEYPANYTVIIPTDSITDLGGNELQEDFILTFKTDAGGW